MRKRCAGSDGLRAEDRDTPHATEKTPAPPEFGPSVRPDRSIAEEHRLLTEGPALLERSDRGLLEITGKDRAAWLHNLTTNVVKTLRPGEGNHAFALNVQGRILFDLNVLMRAESIRIDLDRRWLPVALPHFHKYVIVEDVTIADRSGEFVRFGLAGRRAAEFLNTLGMTNAQALPLFGGAKICLGGREVETVRTDFHGAFGVELFAPSAEAAAMWKAMSDLQRPLVAVPVGEDAVQVHRIESGIPWPGREITDEYLPAETRQLSRAVSFQKGCYLGQEIVERMRSRHVVSRLLTLVRFEGATAPPPGAALHGADDRLVGEVTSSCLSVRHGAPLALGYVKAAASEVGSPIRAAWRDGQAHGVVVEPGEGGVESAPLPPIKSALGGAL